MGFTGISMWELVIILLIVIMIFGTKRLKTLGSDLGSAVKGFRKAMEQESDKALVTEDVKRIERVAADAQLSERKEKTSSG